MPVPIEELVPDHIRVLKPYEPGKPIEQLEREIGIRDAIKVASNENPLGASPLARAAAIAALDKVHMYPDGSCFLLRERLAAELGVDGDKLLFGGGSNELIYVAVNTFCRPGDTVISHKYAFTSYRLAAMSMNIEFIETAVTDELVCDVDAMLAAVDERTRIVFLANPNNPTGAYVPKPELERLLAGLPEHVIFVVDEAYHEYACRAVEDYPTSISYHGRSRPHMITLRTFSKIHGLAGLRVGYATADKELLGYMNRVRRPFNVNSIAQAAAIAALDDTDHIERSSAVAIEGIASLQDAATKLGLRAYPAAGNFVLVDVRRPSHPVSEALQRRGVIVRPMASWGLPTCLRISVGSPEETRRACASLAEVL